MFGPRWLEVKMNSPVRKARKDRIWGHFIMSRLCLSKSCWVNSVTRSTWIMNGINKPILSLLKKEYIWYFVPYFFIDIVMDKRSLILHSMDISDILCCAIIVNYCLTEVKLKELIMLSICKFSPTEWVSHLNYNL